MKQRMRRRKPARLVVGPQHAAECGTLLKEALVPYEVSAGNTDSVTVTRGNVFYAILDWYRTWCPVSVPMPPLQCILPRDEVGSLDVLATLRVPAFATHVVQNLARAAFGLQPSVIVPCSREGALFATMVAFDLGVSLVNVRKEGTGVQVFATTTGSFETHWFHGNEVQEWTMEPCKFTAEDRVVLVDDVVCSGDLANRMHTFLKSNGANVVGLVVVVTTGDTHKLSSLPVHTLVTMPHIRDPSTLIRNPSPDDTQECFNKLE